MAVADTLADTLAWPFFDAAHRGFARSLGDWADETLAALPHDEVDAACRARVRALGDAGFLKAVVPAQHGGQRSLRAREARLHLRQRQTQAAQREHPHEALHVVLSVKPVAGGAATPRAYEAEIVVVMERADRQPGATRQLAHPQERCGRLSWLVGRLRLRGHGETVQPHAA